MNDLDPMMVGRHVNNLVNNLTPGKTPHKSSFNDMNFDFIEEDPLEYEHKQQDNSTSQNNGKKSNTNGQRSGTSGAISGQQQKQGYPGFNYASGATGGNMDVDSNSGATNQQVYQNPEQVLQNQNYNMPQNQGFNNEEQTQLLLIQREMNIERANLHRAPNEIQEQILFLRQKKREIDAEIRGLQRALLLKTHPAYVNNQQQQGPQQQYNQYANMNPMNIAQQNQNPIAFNQNKNMQQNLDVQRINANLYNNPDNMYANEMMNQGYNQQQMNQFNNGMFHFQNQNNFQAQSYNYQNDMPGRGQNMNVGMGRKTRQTPMNYVNQQLYNQPQNQGNPYNQFQPNPMESHAQRTMNYLFKEGNVENVDESTNSFQFKKFGADQAFSQRSITKSKALSKKSEAFQNPSLTPGPIKKKVAVGGGAMSVKSIKSSLAKPNSNYGSSIQKSVNFDLRNIENTSSPKLDPEDTPITMDDQKVSEFYKELKQEREKKRKNSIIERLEEENDELVDDEGFVAPVNGDDSLDVEDEGEIDYTPE